MILRNRMISSIVSEWIWGLCRYPTTGRQADGGCDAMSTGCINQEHDRRHRFPNASRHAEGGRAELLLLNHGQLAVAISTPPQLNNAKSPRGVISSLYRPGRLPPNQYTPPNTMLPSSMIPHMYTYKIIPFRPGHQTNRTTRRRNGRAATHGTTPGALASASAPRLAAPRALPPP